MRSAHSRSHGLWLGAISLPVLWAVWISDGFLKPELSDGALGFAVGLSLLGSVGMALGGIVGFHSTRMIRSPGLRVVTLTVIAPGIAFVIASLPFLLLYVVGAFLAWWLSVTKWGLYAYAVTLLWSLVCVRRATRFEAGESTVPDDGLGLIPATLLGLWGLLTLYLAVAAMINPSVLR